MDVTSCCVLNFSVLTELVKSHPLGLKDHRISPIQGLKVRVRVRIQDYADFSGATWLHKCCLVGDCKSTISLFLPNKKTGNLEPGSVSHMLFDTNARCRAELQRIEERLSSPFRSLRRSGKATATPKPRHDFPNLLEIEGWVCGELYRTPFISYSSSATTGQSTPCLIPCSHGDSLRP